VQKLFHSDWISAIQFDDLCCFLDPVLLKLSPTSVQSSSTAFLVVVSDGDDLHLAFNFDPLRFHRFEAQFCRKKEEKIDALNVPM